MEGLKHCHSHQWHGLLGEWHNLTLAGWVLLYIAARTQASPTVRATASMTIYYGAVLNRLCQRFPTVWCFGAEYGILQARDGIQAQVHKIPLNTDKRILPGKPWSPAAPYSTQRIGQATKVQAPQADPVCHFGLLAVGCGFSITGLEMGLGLLLCRRRSDGGLGAVSLQYLQYTTWA